MASSSLNDMTLLLKAATFAAKKHDVHRRKNARQSAYITHPLQVADYIAGPGSSLHPNAPLSVLQAAILHDTVEDTDTTLEELTQEFGPEVARIVEECTDDKNASKASRKQAQIDRAPQKSTEAKLADKLANLTDLVSTDGVPVGWTAERVQEYFVWGKRVTDGCKDVNNGLASQLDTLYKTATFVFKGKVYKAHPTYT